MAKVTAMTVYRRDTFLRLMVRCISDLFREAWDLFAEGNAVVVQVFDDDTWVAVWMDETDTRQSTGGSGSPPALDQLLQGG